MAKKSETRILAKLRAIYQEPNPKRRNARKLERELEKKLEIERTLLFMWARCKLAAFCGNKGLTVMELSASSVVLGNNMTIDGALSSKDLAPGTVAKAVFTRLKNRGYRPRIIKIDSHPDSNALTSDMWKIRISWA